MGMKTFFAIYLLVGYVCTISEYIYYGGWNGVMKALREEDGYIADYFSENFIKFSFFCLCPLLWPVGLFSHINNFIKGLTDDGDDDFE